MKGNSKNIVKKKNVMFWETCTEYTLLSKFVVDMLKIVINENRLVAKVDDFQRKM